MRGDRLLSLLLLLQAHGRMSARRLADRLEVSERTVYRDLDALSSAGVPVYAELGRNGGAVLMEDFRTDLTGLTEDEARALFTAIGPQLVDDLGLGPRLEAALRKLMAALPEAQRPGAERARGRVLVDASGWSRPADPVPHLATIQEAAWNDQTLIIGYRRGDGQAVAREVSPLGLVAKAGVWYLVGEVEGERRVYRISRVESVTPTGRGFARPAGFDLAAAWSASREQFESRGEPYPVRVRVSAQVRPLFDKLIRGRVTAPPEPAPPGEVVLTFPGLGAARAALVPFGVDIEVLEPDSLREDLAAWAARLAAMYA